MREAAKPNFLPESVVVSAESMGEDSMNKSHEDQHAELQTPSVPLWFSRKYVSCLLTEYCQNIVRKFVKC